MTDRGQAHALEGVMAALLVVIAVVLAYQAIVLTPTTAGTVDRDVKSHLGTRAGDVLTAAGNDGSLSRIVRFWNVSAQNGTGGFVEADGFRFQRGSGYRGGSDGDLVPGRFGELLSELEDDGYIVNVYLETRDPEDPSSTNRYALVNQGEPTGNAAVAARTVTLYDHQYQTMLPDGSDTLVRNENASRIGDLGGDDYFAGDLEGPVYNVVTVEVVVW